MEFLEAVILGVVQGLTEFLPISSSGHLRIVPAMAGWEDPGAAFTAVIQIGTMLAVLIYFRHELWGVTRDWTRATLRIGEPVDRQNVRLGWYLGLGTLPIIFFGVLFNDQIENEARNLYVIGTTLIVLGLLLGLADHLATHKRGMEKLTRRDAAIIGFAQALALVPGVSRSGATLTAGLALGLKRTDAARFSFLLSVPAVVLSGLYELRTAFDGEWGGGVGTGDVIVATILSFIVGYAAIAFLLRWLGSHNTLIFVVYRVFLGVAVLALAANGTIS
ncbi:MAG: undecaprenyl-diphosphate phosphatase [Actinobacteria bacterium]|nr:undecaprenyl-diphosphate phosphatase [Actinomycetota bacterium]